MKKAAFTCLVLSFAASMSEGSVAAQQGTTIQFILGSPAPGNNAGEVYVNVEWTNAPAGSVVTVAFYQVLDNGTYIFINRV